MIADLLLSPNQLSYSSISKELRDSEFVLLNARQLEEISETQKVTGSVGILDCKLNYWKKKKRTQKGLIVEAMEDQIHEQRERISELEEREVEMVKGFKKIRKYQKIIGDVVEKFVSGSD